MSYRISQKLILVFFITIVNVFFVFTQESTPARTLSKSFAGISLGDSYDSIKNTLKEGSLWFFYEERVFVPLALNESRVIALEGRYFLKNAYLLFSEDNTLQSLSIFIDENKITYNTMYEKLLTKYGRPNLKVNQAIWKDEETTIIMEKPLHIKFIQNNIAPSPAEDTEDIKREYELREEFLELF